MTNATAPKTIRLSFHPVHYVLVAFGTLAVFVLEVNVPILASGLRVSPFILVSAMAAMFGDYLSGILAIILGGVGAAYAASPTGPVWTANNLFKVLELMLIATFIFILSWRSRKLYVSNVRLEGLTRKLQAVTVNLKTEAKGNQKQLQKLNEVNKELTSLVGQFIADDEYWARKITTPVPPTSKKRTNGLSS